MVDAAMDAIIAIDADGRVVEWNPQAEAMFGWSSSEAAGDFLADLIVPSAYRKIYAEGLAEYRRTGEGAIVGKRVELEGLHRDGHTFPVELSIAPLGPGLTPLLAGSVRDLTAERQAAAVATRLAAIVDSSDDAIYSTDANGTLQTWNSGAEALYGYTEAEAVGMPQAMLVPPEIAGEGYRLLNRVLAGESILQYETRRVRKNGRVFDAWLTWSPLRGDAGQIVGASVICRDITDRIRAEAAQRDSERSFRMLASNSSDLVLWLRAGKIAWTSPSVKRFGWEPTDLIERGIVEFAHPDDVVMLLWMQEHSDQVTEDARLRFRFRTNNGGFRWVESDSRPNKDEAGIANGLVVAIRDVTEQVKTEDALQASETEFRQLAENAADIVVRVAPGGEHVWVSDSVRDALGWEPQEFLALSDSEIFHPDDLPRVLDLRSAGGLEELRIDEARGRLKNGEWVWLSSRSRPLPDGGRIVALRVVDSEVKAHEALMASEVRYRLLAENASDVVMRLANDATIGWVSPAVDKLLGWQPDELIGRGAHDLMHPDDLPTLWSRLDAVDDGASGVGHIRARCADGSYRWVLASQRQLKDNGEVIGKVVSLTDAEAEIDARRALDESEEDFRLVAENATDVVWRMDRDSVMQWVSPSLESVLGWRPEQLIGTDPADLIHPADKKDLEYLRAQSRSGSRMQPIELRVRLADSSYRWMSIQVRPTTGSDGSVNGAIVGLRDAHNEKLAREQLASSEQLFRLATNGAPQGVAVLGLHFRFVHVNKALCKLVDRDEEWLLSHSIRDVVHPEDLERELADHDQLLAGMHEAQEHERRWLKPDGSVVWVQHSTGLLRDERGMPLFFVSHLQDTTEAHQAKAELTHQAYHDALTGVINRHQLEGRIESALKRLARVGSSVGLLYCDVDDFKTINDRYGHAGGDAVLKLTAERIASTVRSDDLVIRAGGDEFIVVINEPPDVSSAQYIAQKIRTAVHKPIPVLDSEVTPTLSIGVAMAGPSTTADELLHAADHALYMAKESGRNRVVIFDPAADNTGQGANPDLKGFSDPDFGLGTLGTALA